MIDRREFLMSGGVLAFAAPVTASPQTAQRGTMQTNNTDPFWPDKARLVISISMQMEAGAQPESGAESPLPKIDSKYPDIAATQWYEHGFKEGLPRLLDMFDRRNVKVLPHGGRGCRKAPHAGEGDRPAWPRALRSWADV